MRLPKTCAILLGVAPALVTGFEVHRDVPYGDAANGRQSLDWYAPDDGGDHPIVVWIHGGGWMHGDKGDDMRVKPQAFCDQGFVLVSVNYRFIPEVTIGGMAGDVAAAIHWAYAHAKECGGDPNSIFVIGHSAGAQLAALVCTDGSYLEAQGMSLHDIKGCVPIDGDTYYPALQIDTAQPKLADSYRLKFPDGDSQRRFSSVLHVSPDAGIPPFLILYIADHPASGTQLQSEILAKSLREAGVPVEVVACAGKTHVTVNADLGLPGDQPTQAIFGFLEARAHSTP